MITQRTNELSDEQLMARLDRPEIEASISALYDRYSRTVFGVGLNILGDRSMTEELVQEVYLKVWRSSGTFDPSRGSFSTWLYRVTRSVALDLYRKRAHRVRPVRDGDMHIATTRDSSAGPEEILYESWLSWRVSKALEMLDAPHREVIELAYFGGSPRGRSPRGPVFLWAPSRAEPRGPSRDCAGNSPPVLLCGREYDEVRGDPGKQTTRINNRVSRKATPKERISKA